MDVDQLAALQEYNARRWLRARARYLVGGKQGRGKLDPVYVQVTQGRDVRSNWAHWSSCGELVQCLAYELGCRGRFVNRSESPGGWRSGRNLLDFYDQEHVPDAPAVAPPHDYAPACGDIGFIWTNGGDAHTFVFGDQVDATHIETFNYGAGGMQPIEFPGAIARDSVVSKHDGVWWVGTRILHEVATVPALLAHASAELMPDITAAAIAELEGLIP